MGITPERLRRRPETTTRYRIVQQRMQTLCAHLAAADGTGQGALPSFVERELHAFLDCGMLSRGFCRASRRGSPNANG